MKILVLNGSPRPNRNTAAMADAFVEGAKENGHEMIVAPKSSAAYHYGDSQKRGY